MIGDTIGADTARLLMTVANRLELQAQATRDREDKTDLLADVALARMLAKHYANENEPMECREVRLVITVKHDGVIAWSVSKLD